MADEGYHESVSDLSSETRDMHRAVSSLVEELEAVSGLKAILAHNRDEEKEHAAMAPEWIRRRGPVFDKELRDCLFTERPVSGKVFGWPEA